MGKTIAFVTNQQSSERLIESARKIADITNTELVVVDILDSEYELVPETVDFLFTLSKKNRATMRILFTDNKVGIMREVIADADSKHIVTGMPGNSESILYDLWREYPKVEFFAIDQDGQTVEVSAKSRCHQA